MRNRRNSILSVDLKKKLLYHNILIDIILYFNRNRQKPLLVVYGIIIYGMSMST